LQEKAKGRGLKAKVQSTLEFTPQLFEFARSAGFQPAISQNDESAGRRQDAGAPCHDKLKLELQPRRFNLPA